MNSKIRTMIGFAVKSGNFCVGEELCRRGVLSKKISLLFIANDMSPKTSEKMKELCDSNQVRFVEIYSKEELSESVGKKDKVLVGITSKQFSREIISIIDNQ